MLAPQYELQSTLTIESLEGPVSLAFFPHRARFNLRLAKAHVAAASKALDVTLPTTIGNAAFNNNRSALSLGPDEWVLYIDETDAFELVDACTTIYETVPHSLVDVSDREVVISLKGEQALTLLSVGCPTDLRDMPIGSGRRTIFDGATVVIHRDGQDEFRMDVWRSFLPHVWETLNIANRELATGY